MKRSLRYYVKKEDLKKTDSCQILPLLKSNSRIAVSEITQRTGIPKSTVHERIKMIGWNYRFTVVPFFNDKVLSPLDQKLVNLLKKDSRTPLEELARNTGIRRGQIRFRVENIRRWFGFTIVRKR